MPASEAGEIEAVARDYIEGWYTGNAERMARSLHDDLVKRVPEGDTLRVVSKQRMVDLTAAGDGVAADAAIEIFVDDVAGDIAAARVLSPDYLDYLQLVKTPAGWQIANILFHGRS